MKLDDELDAAAQRLETAPGVDAAYLHKARESARRLAPIDLARGDVRGALGLVEQQVEIDPIAPVASNQPGMTWVKRGLQRVLGWYGRWLAHQVTALARAVARFATATAERLEMVEARAVEHERVTRDELDDLAARVAALEAHRDPTA